MCHHYTSDTDSGEVEVISDVAQGKSSQYKNQDTVTVKYATLYEEDHEETKWHFPLLTYWYLNNGDLIILE